MCYVQTYYCLKKVVVGFSTILKLVIFLAFKKIRAFSIWENIVLKLHIFSFFSIIIFFFLPSDREKYILIFNNIDII